MKKGSFSIANTYVYHNEEGFNVSTIDRESSAELAYGSRYAETIVWDISRKGILHMDSGLSESIITHNEITEKIHRLGRFWDDEED